jgi:hypothetical protein
VRGAVLTKERVSEKKTCFKCGEAKLLTDFYKHSKMADGRLNKCKECTKKDLSKNYLENIDHYAEYEKSRSSLPHRVKAREEYAQTEQGKIAGNKAKRKYAARNPERQKATCAVNNAVRDGRLQKLPCEKCGSTNRVHGHHEDYNKPLDVIWLCPQCHKEHHAASGEVVGAGSGKPGKSVDRQVWKVAP